MIKDEMADCLVYATARITCNNDSGIANGSGFFMSHKTKNGERIVFVTNKHVVDGYTNASIKIVKQDTNGKPSDNIHTTINFPNLQHNCIFHNDKSIDACLILIENEISELDRQGKRPYLRHISSEMILKPTVIDSLTSIEDIIMIGYPSGIMDETNCKPIIRNGITATNLKLNYNDTPTFLIDAACFPGSSGSPVFLRKIGLVQERIAEGTRLGLQPSYALLGILFAGPTFTIDGEIVLENIPTQAVPIAKMKTMMNLGIVVKIEKIIELFDKL